MADRASLTTQSLRIDLYSSPLTPPGLAPLMWKSIPKLTILASNRFYPCKLQTQLACSLQIKAPSHQNKPLRPASQPLVLPAAAIQQSTLNFLGRAPASAASLRCGERERRASALRLGPLDHWIRKSNGLILGNGPMPNTNPSPT